MLERPFDVVKCSWPQPVTQSDGVWTSEPSWNAAAMPTTPVPQWEMVNEDICWMIDWRQYFKSGLRVWDPGICGEMRNFSVTFQLRIRGSGKLVFWDDDGCIIRRNRVIVHEDRSAHMLTRHEIEVEAEDCLEVAQWQLFGGWLWGARWAHAYPSLLSSQHVLEPYRQTVQQFLQSPNGPPLKFFTHGATPARATVALYSMILNGYRPSEVLLFGEHQWPPHVREWFTFTLPFATVVPNASVLEGIGAVGGTMLRQSAQRHWFVLKTFIALLYPPREFCLLDDDVFILDHVTDALNAFKQHDLVYAPDTDHGRAYQTTWGWLHRDRNGTRNGTFNAGLYWMRNSLNPRQIATAALRVRPEATSAFVWEQGFIATLFAGSQTLQLPTERYFYPLFDGLPGGALGYDYKENPCGFASVHFGGLLEKPSDLATLLLVDDLLGNPSRRI